MFLNWRTHAALWLAAIMVLVLAILTLPGCGAKQPGEVIATPEKASAPEVARDAVQGQLVLSNAIYLFGEWVEKFPGDSIPKTQISDQWLLVKSANDAQNATIKTVEPAVIQTEKEKQSLQKENAKLRADDPARKTLERVGFWTAIGGLTLIIGSFFLTTYLPLWVGHLRAAGIFLLLLGLSAYSLAWYLVEIRLVFICLIGVALVAGLVWAIIYAIRNRRLLVDSIKGIDVGRAAGQIIFTPEASDPAKSVVKAFQADLTQQFVDAVQGKTPAASTTAPPSK